MIKVVNFDKIMKVVLILILSMIHLSACEVFCRESSCVKILTGLSVRAKIRENNMCREAYKPNFMVAMINSDELKRIL